MGNTALLIGTGLQMGASFAKGGMIKDASEYEAKGLNRAAASARASGQRNMFEEQNKLAQVTSAQRAIAAASGSPTGPTISDIMEDTAMRGKYLADFEMWKGEEKARGLEDQAAAAKFKGNIAKTDGYVGTILAGLDGAYKYKKSTYPMYK